MEGCGGQIGMDGLEILLLSRIRVLIVRLRCEKELMLPIVMAPGEFQI